MDCPSYECVTLEYVTHRLWFFSIVITAWEFAFSFFFQLQLPLNIIISEKALKFEQCLFIKHLFNKVKKFSSLWTLLRGVTMWAIWNERNDLIFNNNMWHEAKLRKILWERLIDYRKLE